MLTITKHFYPRTQAAVKRRYYDINQQNQHDHEKKKAKAASADSDLENMCVD